MTKLTKSLAAWGSDAFSKTLKAEIEGLESGVLPLSKCASRGGPIDDSDISASVNSVSDNEHFIQARVGVFFYEISAGGACGDADLRENAYGVIQATIDKTTADAEFMVVFE